MPAQLGGRRKADSLYHVRKRALETQEESGTRKEVDR